MLRCAELDIAVGCLRRARRPLEHLAGDGGARWLAAGALAVLVMLDAPAGDAAGADERTSGLLARSEDDL